VLYGGADYLDGANTEMIVLAMIETSEGLANIDSILAVEGLDGIYVGPNDLAQALGRRPANESTVPAVIEEIENVRAKTVAAGKIVGIFCSNGRAAAGVSPP
jgi:4-hydroxy-2-oxoheptanedioate aldolase